jgi:hypothetical protein
MGEHVTEAQRFAVSWPDAIALGAALVLLSSSFYITGMSIGFGFNFFEFFGISDYVAHALLGLLPISLIVVLYATAFIHSGFLQESENEFVVFLRNHADEIGFASLLLGALLWAAGPVFGRYDIGERSTLFFVFGLVTAIVFSPFDRFLLLQPLTKIALVLIIIVLGISFQLGYSEADSVTAGYGENVSHLELTDLVQNKLIQAESLIYIARLSDYFAFYDSTTKHVTLIRADQIQSLSLE